MSVRATAMDLLAEHDALDQLLAPLAAPQWQFATPSPGWTVADQIGHLAYFDDAAVMAITDPQKFKDERDELNRSGRSDPGGYDDMTLAAYRAMSSPTLLASWRDGRAALIDAAAGLDDTSRVDWYGPSMSARSFLTARQMETWAHGQDIVDTVGGHRVPTDRLRNIAQLGVITRSWSYQIRRLMIPEGEVRVVLRAPSGDVWAWGPDECADVVSGGAEDFCLVVTQRRHLGDTSLVVDGALATEWMLTAQAFAGRSTNGPHAGSYAPNPTH